MEENYISEGNPEISLKDLIKTVLGRWKTILICGLAFLLVACLFVFVKGHFLVKSFDERLESAKSYLTDEEIEKVENAAKVINNYREMYKSQKNYNDNSKYQRLDPYNVNTLMLSYYVDNHYQVAYPVINETNNLIPIIQTYVSVFNEESFYDDLSKLFGETDLTYMKELISVSVAEKESGIFTVKIYAESTDELKTIGDYVKHVIDEEKAVVEKIYGGHDILLTSETVSRTIDTSMADAQSRNMERLVAIDANIEKEESLFAGDQLTYLKMLVHDEDEKSDGYLKFAVLGLALGIIVSTVFFAAQYVFSGTVKTNDEFVFITKQSYLGDLNNNYDLTVSRIKNISELNGFKRTALIIETGLGSELETLKSENPEFVVLTDVLNRKDDYEILISCDSAVLIGKLKYSNKKNMISRKLLCEEANIKILGIAVI